LEQGLWKGPATTTLQSTEISPPRLFYDTFQLKAFQLHNSTITIPQTPFHLHCYTKTVQPKLFHQYLSTNTRPPTL
jgi:hypothetical protein